MSYSNPYQSYGAPTPYGQQPAGPTPGYVMAPAVALTIVGAINLVQSMYALGRNLLGMNANAPPPRNVQNNPDMLEIYNALQPYQGAINITLGILAFLFAIVILLAGLQMMRR